MAKAKTNHKGDVIGATVILTCSCWSEYQDSTYGNGRRVHNVGKSDSGCTVCGARR